MQAFARYKPSVNVFQCVQGRKRLAAASILADVTTVLSVITEYAAWWQHLKLHSLTSLKSSHYFEINISDTEILHYSTLLFNLN